MKNWIGIVAVLGLVTGCSKPPSAIKPTPAVGQPFATYDCEQLVIERRQYMGLLDQAVESQNIHAATDVIAGIGFGVIGVVTAKAIAGQDEEANIGTYRGAIIEIDNESRRKECTDPIFFTPEPVRQPQPEMQQANTGG